MSRTGRDPATGTTRRAGAVARGTALLALLAVPVGAVLGARGQTSVEEPQQEPFPHEAHVGLFPLCTGCHAGVATGDRATAYPEAGACAECHDGRMLDAVEWSAPRPRASNLTFTHSGHVGSLAEVGDEPLECESCHSAAADPGPERERMAVRRGRVESCISCHAHEAEAHFSDADCVACHVPLAESGFARARIEALPAPGSHDDPGFLARAHGEAAAEGTAACATCHVRDRCTSCHVDVSGRMIAAVPEAAADMALPAYEAEYPVPDDHRAPGWLEAHNVPTAEARESCATCHTRDDCASCHRAPPPAALDELPRSADVRAPGVGVARRAPESHFESAFGERHGTAAAVVSSACASCHTESFCASCHEGVGGASGAGGGERSAVIRFVAFATRTDPETEAARFERASATPPEPAPDLAPGPGATYRHVVAWKVDGADRLPEVPGADTVPERGSGSGDSGFHPPNFTIRHAADAWGRTLECASCHSTEVFCRSCHLESGLGSRGRVGPGYHDAVPLWLFRHGTAARQGLESCASCHSESQCLQCHSTVGAFRVSPHGPGFEPERARDRNALTCRLCHLSDPLRRPEP